MILLLGSSGYIGTAFVSELRRRGIEFVSRSHESFSVGEWTKVLQDKPDLVINCAAFVTRPSVDLCEDFKEECLLGNFLFAVRLSDACELMEVPLLHVSTGCLYQGGGDRGGWRENDIPLLHFDTGAGFYTGSKHLAEQVILQNPAAYACRIRLPFDEFDDPRNILSKYLHYPFVVDGVNSYTHRGDFVKACLDLWEKRAPFGCYNMTNWGGMWAYEIVERMNGHICPRRKFTFKKPEDFQKEARTIKSNCVLNTDKLAAAGVIMRPLTEAVEDAIAHWVPEGKHVP